MISLPGLETEIAVTAIRVSPDHDNGRLVLYFNVS